MSRLPAPADTGTPNWMQGLMGGAGIGAGLYGMFGAQNPAQAAMGPEQNAINELPGYYNPYINAGQGALGNLQGQYGQLLNNPGGMLNQIGSNFHASPGFNFAVKNAMLGSNRGMAAGGLAGSPANTAQNEQLGTQLANQNYYQWLGNATGLYNQGLGGEQGLAGMGFNAASGLGQNMADIYNNMAQMQYGGTQYQNQNQGGGLGSLIGGIGSLFGF